jgi:hypothetical protein
LHATALAVATAGAQTGVPQKELPGFQAIQQSDLRFVANPSGASNAGNQVLIGAFPNQQRPRPLMQD